MKIPVVALLAILSNLGATHAVVLLDDTFADGNRTTQNLPSSAAYYFGANTISTASLDAVSNSLQLEYASSANNNLSTTVAYFTASNSPQTLAVGDSLTLSFTLSVTNISNTADLLRFGLFNSNGSRVSGDFAGIADPAFNAYTGYSFWTNLDSAGSNSGTIRQRTGTSNTLFASGATSNLLGNRPPLGYEADTTYTLSLTLEYLSLNNMQITFSDSTGTSYSVTDTVSPFTTFDTLAVFLSNGTTADVTYTMDSFYVEYSPVPEPTTLTALLLGLTALHCRRTRRATASA